jgi:hypothetical protein
LSLGLVGCATDPARVTAQNGPLARGNPVAGVPAVEANAIPVSTGGSDRPYVVLEDMTATARQITIFGHVPTNADVNAELRKRAAELNADAVINVRYGNQGVGAISWSQISGTGQAIKFTHR